MNFKVSIVVPTYNGCSKLPNLLIGLKRQTWSDFELIIVIDGSTDETESVLAEFKNQFSSLNIIKQNNAGRAITRNRGVQAATGDLIIFFDDDIIPHISCVEQHVKFHEKNTGLLSGIPKEEIKQGNNDIQNYKAKLSSTWLSKYADGFNKLNIDNLFFSTANCSIKKIDFMNLGMFNLNLTDGEDYELAYRAIKNNIDVFLDTTNIVLHEDKITIRSYIKRVRQYRIAHKQINQIHPEIDIANYTPAWYKKLIYWLFASNFWIVLFENRIYLRFIPVTLRSRLYSIVIHSLGVVYPQVVIV
jgi:glycosyltransferase involved in cell wall biosynthesis